MGVQSQSAMIAGLILLSLAINVLFERRRVQHRVAFVTLLSSFALFNLAWFFFSVTESGFWRSLLLLSSIAIAHANLSFFERFLETSLRSWRTLATVMSGVILVLIPTDLASDPMVTIMAGSLAFGIYSLCILRLYRRYRETENEVEATRLSYLVYGGMISIVLIAFDLLPILELPSPALGHIWTTVYMYFWMQVILRSRLLDLQDILGRGLALIVLSIIISTMYVALLVWVEGSLGLFFFNTVAASVLLYFVFEPLKRIVDHWVGRLFFRPTHDLEQTLNQIQTQLATVINLEDVFDRVIQGLDRSRRVTHASIMLLDARGRRYAVPRVGGQFGELRRHEVDVVGDRAFLDLLSRQKMLTLDQLKQERFDLEKDMPDVGRRAQLENAEGTMEAMSASLSFAFISGDRLLGFLNLNDDRQEEAFSSYEISLLVSLTTQITTAIENSELVRKLKDRDRLYALGEMATGMAHEVRNPLGAIKSAAQLLVPAEDDADSSSLVRVIVDETNRLGGVIEQFLNFARPYEGAFDSIDLEQLVQQVCVLADTDKAIRHLTIKTDLAKDLPPAYGDADQLHRVLLNLIRNAADAIGEADGHILLGARLVHDVAQPRLGGPQRRLEVFIQDDGPGIPPEVLRNLFIPFFTTKTSGTGLGLAICQRIMQRHGSEVSVESTLGEGTTMSFQLFLNADADAFTGEFGQRITAGGLVAWSE
ncbi:MAG: ATP-binding protein [Myxococcota bacterium]|nr:ATP-binding protein [Myxococcota bacterium]